MDKAAALWKGKKMDKESEPEKEEEKGRTFRQDHERKDGGKQHWNFTNGTGRGTGKYFNFGVLVVR